jgi:hypothetical protein
MAALPRMSETGTGSAAGRRLAFHWSSAAALRSRRAFRMFRTREKNYFEPSSDGEAGFFLIDRPAAKRGTGSASRPNSRSAAGVTPRRQT